MSRLLTTNELIRALSLRDLTDPAAGPHAMQLLLAEIHAALPVPVHVHRASPIVSIADNYDRLGYPKGGAARDDRYTRYVCDTALLRSQTSAMIPPLLESELGDDVDLGRSNTRTISTSTRASRTARDPRPEFAPPSRSSAP